MRHDSPSPWQNMMLAATSNGHRRMRNTPVVSYLWRGLEALVPGSGGYVGEPLSWSSFVEKFDAYFDDPESVDLVPLVLSHVGPFYAAGMGSQKGRVLTTRQRMYWGSRGVMDGMLEDCEAVKVWGLAGGTPQQRCWGAIFNMTRIFVTEFLANGAASLTHLREGEAVSSSVTGVSVSLDEIGLLKGIVVEANKRTWSEIEEDLKRYLSRQLGLSGPVLSAPPPLPPSPAGMRQAVLRRMSARGFRGR